MTEPEIYKLLTEHFDKYRLEADLQPDREMEFLHKACAISEVQTVIAERQIKEIEAILAEAKKNQEEENPFEIILDEYELAEMARVERGDNLRKIEQEGGLL